VLGAFKPGSRKTVICKAIDVNKFVHSIKPSSEVDIDSRLLSDFKHYWPTLVGVSSKDQLLSLVNMNSGIREWYTHWNLLEAQAETFPDFLDKTNLKDLALFADLTADQVAYKAKCKNWQDRTNAASKVFKDTISGIEAEKAAAYAQLKPLHAISMVTVNQLPPESQLIIAGITDKQERSRRSAELILSYQKELKTQVDNGTFTNPFVS
jgi:hypothetical protein